MTVNGDLAEEEQRAANDIQLVAGCSGGYRIRRRAGRGNKYLHNSPKFESRRLRFDGSRSAEGRTSREKLHYYVDTCFLALCQLSVALGSDLLTSCVFDHY